MAHPGIGDGHDLVFEYMEVSRAASGEVPSNGLRNLHLSAQEVPSSRLNYLPELHIANDPIRDLTECPPMWPVGLLLSVPPLWDSTTVSVEPQIGLIHVQLDRAHPPSPIADLLTLEESHCCRR